MPRLRSYRRHIISETIVQNPVASTATGTAIARIVGLHGELLVGIGLAYYTTSKHQPSSFGANTFSLFQVDQNGDGDVVQLSATPVNGSTGQAAPDKWEGQTVLPQLELQHAYAGMGAADVGRWDVIVTVVPADDLCDEDFERLAGQVGIQLRGSAVVLS